MANLAIHTSASGNDVVHNSIKLKYSFFNKTSIRCATYVHSFSYGHQPCHNAMICNSDLTEKLISNTISKSLCL